MNEPLLKDIKEFIKIHNESFSLALCGKIKESEKKMIFLSENYMHIANWINENYNNPIYKEYREKYSI